MRKDFLFEFLKLISTVLVTYLLSRFVPISEENKELYSLVILILGLLTYEIFTFILRVIWPLHFEFILLSNNGSSPNSTHIEEENSDKEKILKLNITLRYSNIITKNLMLYLLDLIKININISPTNEKIYIRGDNYKKVVAVNNGVEIDMSNVIKDIIKLESTNQPSSLGYILYIRTKPLGELIHTKSSVKCNLEYVPKTEKNLKFRKLLMKTSIKKKETDHEIIYFKGEN
ncbi:hypothetical protein M2L35_001726 [Staphylococcus pseudintermedius]|uniref:hypothetical protein n=1 Tax=Staphylococcus pseudintermedius TaxID=283734 RepID=UPI001A21B094|nr:hypothetical protein [Staphylococcus pseudintermedius]EIA5780768.1 hypothetical protein [Staphylococcus pseudintermedius]EII6316401.1 hypothetical protein [Staphylococcus pseudintermedius]EJD5763381.1 hypothetical protein [Staphylococcus pseudintermedius]EJO7112321.1 hypothetical protein [Staphylococcus pseudintermedius]